MQKECPRCRLLSIDWAVRCECGFEFPAGIESTASQTGADSDWYYKTPDGTKVPVSLSDLESQIDSGLLKPGDEILRPGTSDWVAAETVPDLYDRFSSGPQWPSGGSDAGGGTHPELAEAKRLFPLIRIHVPERGCHEIVKITAREITIERFEGELTEELLVTAGNERSLKRRDARIPLDKIRSITMTRGYLPESSKLTTYNVRTTTREWEFQIATHEKRNVDKALRILLGHRFSPEVTREYTLAEYVALGTPACGPLLIVWAAITGRLIEFLTGCLFVFIAVVQFLGINNARRDAPPGGRPVTTSQRRNVLAGRKPFRSPRSRLAGKGHGLSLGRSRLSIGLDRPGRSVFAGASHPGRVSGALPSLFSRLSVCLLRLPSMPADLRSVQTLRPQTTCRVSARVRRRPPRDLSAVGLDCGDSRD